MTDLGASLPASSPEGLRKQPSVPVLIGMLLLAALLLFLRKPHAFLNPQFHCEDAAYFFLSAHQGPELFRGLEPTPYLLLMSRLVAWLTDLFTVRYAPHVYNAYALLITLATVAYVFSPRLRFPYRPLLALAVVLAPCSANEVIVNLTNTHWYLAIMLVLLSVSDDAATRGQWALDVAILAVAGSTGPFILLFFPLFVYRAWVRRSKASWQLLLAAAAMAGVQAYWLASHSWYRPAGTLDLPFDYANPAWLNFIGNGISGALIAGGQAERLPPNMVSLAVASLVLCAGLAAHAAWCRDHMRLMFLAAGAAVLAATAVSWKGKPELIPPGAHYHFPALLLLLWTLLLTAATTIRGVRRNVYIAAPTILVLLWTTGAAIWTLRAPAPPDYRWATDEYLLVDSPGEVMLPITPVGFCVNYENPATSKSTAQEQNLLPPGQQMEQTWDAQAPERELTLKLPGAGYASGLRVKYKLLSQAGGTGNTQATVTVQWSNSARSGRWGKAELKFNGDGQVHMKTFLTCAVMDVIRIRCDSAASGITVYEIVRLY